jgi:hypothetical protein
MRWRSRPVQRLVLLSALSACGSPAPPPNSVTLVHVAPSASVTPVDAPAIVHTATPVDNHVWCLAEAAKREPSWPCELPRDAYGRPQARSDHTLQCGHLLTAICNADELCSQQPLTGMKPTWMHHPAAAGGVPGLAVYCYAVPQACSQDITCECIKPAVTSRMSCPRGTFFECAQANDQRPDLTVECASIR